MTEQAKVPAIRFAGFTDPWEQRKLGELFFESNERSSSMEILSVSVAKGIYPASESDRDHKSRCESCELQSGSQGRCCLQQHANVAGGRWVK